MNTLAKPHYIWTPDGLVQKPKAPQPMAQIRASLVERGTSYRQWAIGHGYEPRTVTQAVSRWAGRHDLPRGRLTFRILRDLSRYLGKEVVPGVMRDAA